MNKISIYISALLVTAMAISSCNKDDISNEDQIVIPEGYSLLWSDEFNENTLNLDKWEYETGDGTDYGLPVGWGNNEMQIYTESINNSGITTDNEMSVLYITALSDGDGGYTSAKLHSLPLSSNATGITFGKIEVKAKMPQGNGLWPAIWMLGDNIDLIDWPGCGEIDIVEVLGSDPSKMYSTVHYTTEEHKHGEIQSSYTLTDGTFADSYHIYGIDWTPEKIIFSMDGTKTHEVIIKEDMKEFLRSFYMNLNVAVGGNWPGYPDNTTTFPQTMYVDYVRIFTKDGFNAPTPPELDIEEETIGQIIEPSLAQNAINDNFTYLGDATVLVWGSGGEPNLYASEIAINGDSSLAYNFPGSGWGGGYIELMEPKDLNGYTNIKFSLNYPDEMTTAEIKVESPSTNFSIFLIDYTGVDVGNGFVEYTIPLSDFADVDFTEITIPFSLWNPQDAELNYVSGAILIDNIYFTN